MQLSQEIANLHVELRARYVRLIARNDPLAVRKANDLIAALYVLGCGSVVVALNALAGKGWRKVMIDRKGVKVLSVNLSGNSMLDKVQYNLEQFVTITAAIKEPRSKAQMNRYLIEWHDVVDDANVRLHALVKDAGKRQ